MLPINFINEVNELKEFYICKCGNKYSFDIEDGRKYCSKCSVPKAVVDRVHREARETIERILNIDINGRNQETASEKQISFANLELLLKVHPPMKINSRGESKLHRLCKRKAANELKACLDEDANDINHKDYAGWTPLHEAVESGSADCVQILLEAGALPSIPGFEYVTPLHKAIKTGRLQLIQMLLEYGASPEAMDYWGKKPEDYTKNRILIIMMGNFLQCNLCPLKSVYIPNEIDVFLCKNVHEDVTHKLKDFKGLCNDIDKATHLIIDKEETIDMNVLQAVLKGLFIYKEEWINQFDGNPEIYPVHLNLIASSKPGFLAALQNRLLKRPDLFHGINFHITGHKKPVVIHGVSVKQQDLIKLVTCGGGNILKRAPTPGTVENKNAIAYHLKDTKYKECKYFIIYDHRNPPQLLYNMKELLHKTSEWLLNSILEFKFD